MENRILSILNRRQSENSPCSASSKSSRSLRVEEDTVPRKLRSTSNNLLSKNGEIKENKYRYIAESLLSVRQFPRIELEQISSKVLYLPGKVSQKTLLIDLDETLVHCSERNPQLVIPMAFESGRTVNLGFKIRPYAEYFLEEASKLFEIVIFTASQKNYADSILDHLDPKRNLISYRLYRDSCIRLNGLYVKDLRIFGNRNLKDILILDNSIHAFGNQIDNGIPITTWFSDRKDSQLLKCLKYLKSIVHVNDVRVPNRKTFGLKRLLDS